MQKYKSRHLYFTQLFWKVIILFKSSYLFFWETDYYSWGDITCICILISFSLNNVLYCYTSDTICIYPLHYFTRPRWTISFRNSQPVQMPIRGTLITMLRITLFSGAACGTYGGGEHFTPKVEVKHPHTHRSWAVNIYLHVFIKCKFYKIHKIHGTVNPWIISTLSLFPKATLLLAGRQSTWAVVSTCNERKRTTQRHATQKVSPLTSAGHALLCMSLEVTCWPVYPVTYVHWSNLYGVNLSS